MRRLLIWIGLFGLTVWVALRVLRALDHASATDEAPPRTDAIPPPADSAAADAPPRTDAIPSGTDGIDGVPTPPPATDDVAIEAYCARCRTRRVLNNIREETTANGRRAARGACSVCGTTVFTFLPTKQAT
jgi:DNA topoisomerase-1